MVKKVLLIDLVLAIVVVGALFATGVIGGRDADRNAGSEVSENRVSEMPEDNDGAEEAENTGVTEETETAGEGTSEGSIEASESDYTLILVNPWNAISDVYFDNLNTVETEGGYYVASQVKEPLEAMLADCREAGCSPVIISAFRSRETQEYLYNTTANKDDTAYPGTSEHECGLAVDILEAGYGGDWDNAEKTAETKTEKWLTANCHKYGFILRYPKDKEDITGIVYESWHYRYVGVEAAEKIMSSGQCLEEYLNKIDTGKTKIKDM